MKKKGYNITLGIFIGLIAGVIVGTKILRSKGEFISERTVGKYMRQMGVRVQMNSLTQIVLMPFGVMSSLIFGLLMVSYI